MNNNNYNNKIILKIIQLAIKQLRRKTQITYVSYQQLNFNRSLPHDPNTNAIYI